MTMLNRRRLTPVWLWWLWYGGCVYHILKLLMIAQSNDLGKDDINNMNNDLIQANDKIKSSILYILMNAGNMKILRLAKTIYLSDYLYAKTFGAKNSFLSGHQREAYGPLPNGFYPALRCLYAEGKAVREGNDIRLKSRSIVNNLNKQELACIDKVLEKIKTASLTKVMEAAYNTEPMIAIQEKEKTMNGLKMRWARIDLSLVKRHPLFDNDDIDISFMNDPEYQNNLA